jgi:hypothetical protein
MKLLLIRNPGGTHNYGELYVNGELLGETLEDVDRHLETGGKKIDGDTAIPRGRYQVKITYSERFKRPMPLVCNVPGFMGVRIHGGNTEADTHGCPLLGKDRTPTGIANCRDANVRLMTLLTAAISRNEEVWLEVK